MTAVTLREATPADAATLGALHVASWHETYTGMIPDEMLAGLSIDARTAMWTKILSQPDELGCVVVAEDDGRVVGFGSCGPQRDKALADAGFSCEFSAIYVLRSYQGQGIGRSILAAMSKELSSAGHTAVCVWVLRENVPARAFYDRLGGVIVSEKSDEQAGATLVEDAFGWRDMKLLSS